MTSTLLRWLVRAALFTAAAAAQSQSASPSAAARPTPRPDPLDPKAGVPELSYRSAFARFRGFSDDKPVNWREANDEVARIGGWRSYLREAQQPEAKPPEAKPR